MKRFNLFILSFFLFVCITQTAFAETIPERDVIGRDLIIEREENVIEFNKRTGNPNDDIPVKEDIHLVMTKSDYLKIIIAPALYIVGFSAAVFCVIEIRKKISDKRRKSDEQI